MARFICKAALIALTILGVPGQPAFAQVTLIVTTMSPPGGNFSTKFFRPWAERIAGASDGTLKTELRDGYAMANYANVFDRVMNDVVQIGWGMQGIVAGKFPLTEVATMPFEAENAVQASTALWRLYQSDAFGDEYRDVHPLILGTYPMNGVHYAKQPKSLDDFSGLKLRAASKPQADWIEHLSGTSISMPPEDVYTALQRGTIDATLQAWSAFGPLKLQEVTRYHVDTAFGTSTIMIFMSQRKYDSLPAAAKKALDDNSGEAMSREWGQFVEEEARGMRQNILGGPDQTEAHLTPAQESAWKARVAPVTQDWVKAHPGGDKLLQEYRALLASLKPGK